MAQMAADLGERQIRGADSRLSTGTGGEDVRRRAAQLSDREQPIANRQLMRTGARRAAIRREFCAGTAVRICPLAAIGSDL